MKEWLICLFVVAAIAYNGFYMQQPAARKQPFRQFNSHWQQTQNTKMLFCFQRMETMLDVNKCMIKLGVYI